MLAVAVAALNAFMLWMLLTPPVYGLGPWARYYCIAVAVLNLFYLIQNLFFKDQDFMPDSDILESLVEHLVTHSPLLLMVLNGLASLLHLWYVFRMITVGGGPLGFIFLLSPGLWSPFVSVYYFYTQHGNQDD